MNVEPSPGCEAYAMLLRARAIKWRCIGRFAALVVLLRVQFRRMKPGRARAH